MDNKNLFLFRFFLKANEIPAQLAQLSSKMCTHPEDRSIGRRRHRLKNQELTVVGQKKWSKYAHKKSDDPQVK